MSLVALVEKMEQEQWKRAVGTDSRWVLVNTESGIINGHYSEEEEEDVQTMMEEAVEEPFENEVLLELDDDRRPRREVTNLDDLKWGRWEEKMRLCAEALIPVRERMGLSINPEDLDEIAFVVLKAAGDRDALRYQEERVDTLIPVADTPAAA